jgi:glycosyltransferase involved in cell wall biosynthesis
MNIGVDATALYGRYNGVEYALWNLLCGLHAVDNDNHYTVYIPHDGPPPGHIKGFNPRWNWVRLSFDGAEKVRRIGWQQGHLPLQLARDGCDVLHSPTYVAPLMARVPVVLTVYDLIALVQPQFATRLNRLHYGVMLRRSMEHAQRIIVPSQHVKQDLAHIEPDAAARTCVIPLGVERDFLREYDSAERDAVRARYHLPERFLLFVGNFEPKKNLQNLLRALHQIPDAPPLVLAGGARAWHSYESSLQEPDSSSLALRTFSIGYVRRRDLPVLYAMCEAFVFPSLAEGFGLPVLEALASGAAVVTSTAVPLPNLKDVALICDPHNPAAIADGIRRVLHDADLRDHLRHKGRAYARPFTWRHAATMTLDVYRSLASMRIL